jgi:hypothetical protein
MHTPAIKRNVVNTGFAYGRVYSYTPTINVRSRLKAPWFENADNVLGSECNVVGMPCYTLTRTVGRHYTNPAGWAKVLKNETGDEWDDLQFYQLVTGSSSQSRAYSWDWKARTGRAIRRCTASTTSSPSSRASSRASW